MAKVKPKWLSALPKPTRVRWSKLNKRLRISELQNKMLRATNRSLRQDIITMQSIAAEMLGIVDQLRIEAQAYLHVGRSQVLSAIRTPASDGDGRVQGSSDER